MNARPLLYWISTGLVAFVLLSGGAAELAGQKDTLAGMAHLGYPAYFVTILGVWKVLGTVAILAPGFPRLKEWATRVSSSTLRELRSRTPSAAMLRGMLS
jgi:uncharacterized membrane protein YphA (DoxX/SURF4 family)